MEDPWGYNAWSTPSKPDNNKSEEHDVSGSLGEPSWNSGIAWNSSLPEDDTPNWGTSSTFAGIGAALGTSSASSSTLNLDKDDKSKSPPPVLDEADPWGGGGHSKPVVAPIVPRSPSPPSNDLASLPVSPTQSPTKDTKSPTAADEEDPWTSNQLEPEPESDSASPELHYQSLNETPAEESEEEQDESDPWGAGTAAVPFDSSSTPFGIPAVKLDDAFPNSDLDKGLEDHDTTAFEPPPPLPTSLDDVPSISKPEPVSIPDPDDWAQDNAWGQPVPTEPNEEEEEGQVDEWARAVKLQEKQDALVPPERLRAIIEDFKILVGPPMSPPLPPTSKTRSSKTYDTSPEETDNVQEDNWRQYPSDFQDSLTKALSIISPSHTAPPAPPEPAAPTSFTPIPAAAGDDIDPWAAQATAAAPPPPPAPKSASVIPSQSLTLPTLPPFPETNIFKSCTSALKLTRNTHVTRGSILTHFITQPTTSQFEQWEASLRMKKELTSDEMDEGAVPKGWRISVEEAAPSTTTQKPSTGRGIFSSFFSSSPSTKPMPGFGSTSRSASPAPVPRTSTSVERSGSGTPRSSLSVDRSSPAVTPSGTPLATSPTTSTPTLQLPSLAPLPEAPASLFDTPSATSSTATATSPTQEPAAQQQQQEGGAVSRFFSRLTTKRNSTGGKGRNGSMQLSTNDLEFLSDVQSTSPSATGYGDGGLMSGGLSSAGDDTFNLSGALESTSVLPAKLAPPPSAPPPRIAPPASASSLIPSSSSGALLNGGMSAPPSHLDDQDDYGEDDDFGGFGSFESAGPSPAQANPPAQQAAPTASNPVDDFDLIFNSPAKPSAPPQPSFISAPTPNTIKPPKVSPLLPSQIQMQEQQRASYQQPPRYTPPAHLAAAAAGASKRRPIPVARMTGSSSTSSSSSTTAPKLGGPPGSSGAFALPPPPGGSSALKPPPAKQESLLGGLDDDLDFIISGSSAPSFSANQQVNGQQSSASNNYLAPDTSVGDLSSSALTSSTSSMAPLAASSSFTSSGGGFDDFDDFISASGSSATSTSVFSSNGFDNAPRTLRTPSPPRVPAKSPQPTPSIGLGQPPKIPLQMGSFAAPPPSSMTDRKGSLPLPPPPSQEDEWGDFGFEDPITPSATTFNPPPAPPVAQPNRATLSPPPAFPGQSQQHKGFGWTPSNPINPMASALNPGPSNSTSPPPPSNQSMQPSPSEPVIAVSPPLTPNSRRRADSHNKTLSLVNMATQTKGVRWPAPPSPLAEAISPPPPPPIPGPGVKTNADVFGPPGSVSPPMMSPPPDMGGRLLSPPMSPQLGSFVGTAPTNGQTTSIFGSAIQRQPVKSVPPLQPPPIGRGSGTATPILPPPPGMLSKQPTGGSSSGFVSPQSTGGGMSSFAGLDGFSMGSAGGVSQHQTGNSSSSRVGSPPIGGLMPPPSIASAASKPATPSNSQPSGKGGLSAQDLSFFEGL